MDYEEELVQWSRLPRIGSIPFEAEISKEFVKKHAAILEPVLRTIL
jgi:hypothetical protein